MSIDIVKHIKRCPQVYKNIELYPILLLDADIYELFLETMCMPKDYISEKEILKSSYLKYVAFFLQGMINMKDDDGNNESIDLVDKITKLLKYITRQDVFIEQVIDKIIEENILFHYEIHIGNNIFYEYDFDCMREIILEQNGQSLEYIESFNPELEKSLSFLVSSGKSTSLIERIIIYSAISNHDIDDMGKWTITEFEEKESILKKYEEWKIYKPLEASGQITLTSKNSIKNPFEYEKRQTDRYSSIMMDADDLMNEVKQFSK